MSSGSAAGEERAALRVQPGEFYACADGRRLVTLLGSCVAACVRDPVTGVGGMDHFLLPEGGDDGDDPSARYGVHAMERLINRLFALGARRGQLEAKVFGGGRVRAAIVSSDVGARNAAFVRAYLATEGVPVLAHDLGGACARKVLYCPATGRALVKRLRPADDLRERELGYLQRAVERPAAGSVKLF